MERALADGEERKRAEGLAGLLLQGADRSFIDTSHVARSIAFYNVIVRLMAERNCNAFTIECFEFCSSKLPEKWKITLVWVYGDDSEDMKAAGALLGIDVEVIA